MPPPVVTFDKGKSIFTVKIPAVKITVQEIINAVRPQEAIFDFHDIDPIIDAEGKKNFGGGELGGIVLDILPPWLMAFEARPGPGLTVAQVTGGSVVSFETDGVTVRYPFSPTANVHIGYRGDTTGSLIKADQIFDLRRGNEFRKYVIATAAVPARNVAIGRVDNEVILVKADSAVDWSVPVGTYTLFWHYAKLGDANPVNVGPLVLP